MTRVDGLWTGALALCLCCCNESPSASAPAKSSVALPVASAPVAPSAPSAPVGPEPAPVAEMDKDAACERLPAGWLAGEMAAVFNPYSSTRISVRVLAWQVDLDDRPLEVERALVWLRFAPEGKSPFFMLANLYRHPRDKTSWRKSGVTDVQYTGAERYDKPPTRADLDKFLKETWWHFKPSDGFRMTGSEVCGAAWKAAFGEPAWRSYGAEPKGGAPLGSAR